MNKLHPHQHFPECHYCRCQTEYHTIGYKKCYPSHEIAKQVATCAESREGHKLYVYECPRHEGMYHLSKWPNPDRVQFILPIPNFRDYRMRPEDETFHIDIEINQRS